ncbi:MAG: putative transporter [Bacteroidetes bacterium]|nr:putative transporter [Bacteroidota bacterium]
MNWLVDLFMGSGVAHSIMLLAVTIAAGIQLGKLKIANISLGITWILFVGIILSHFGMRIDGSVLHFAKELGLILFVYSIGLQVGPGFFESLKKGGLRLNLLATMVVVLGVSITYALHIITGTDLTTMVGILSGAVTNTPGLGAAQQTLNDIAGQNDPTIAMGYAVAYPLGVIGIILSTLSLKKICRINMTTEAEQAARIEPKSIAITTNILIENKSISGRHIEDINSLTDNKFVISRILHADGKVEIATNKSHLKIGDTVRVITEKTNIDSISLLLGKVCNVDNSAWETIEHDLLSRRIVVTKTNINGHTIGNLDIRALYGVNITRVTRAGIELVASPNLHLQLGDRLTAVGKEDDIKKLADLLGNSLKRLDHPNLIPIFLGIFIGIVVGSIPFMFPGIPQPVKLGLAGGPLIIAILISRFGPYYKMVTFTTTSANMMIREIGISLFLAAVGLGAGEGFVNTVCGGGYWWVLYGIVITILPILIVGIFARLRYKMNYYTLMGLLAGSTTDPPALAFANSQSNNDMASVAYATVYPLTMFLRVLTAQLLIIFSIS